MTRAASTSTEMDPEYALWAAVIRQALKDIHERPRERNEGRTSPTKAERIEALEFFFDPEIETLPYLCKLLGLPLIFVRQQAREEFISRPETRGFEFRLFNLSA